MAEGAKFQLADLSSGDWFCTSVPILKTVDLVSLHAFHGSRAPWWCRSSIPRVLFSLSIETRQGDFPTFIPPVETLRLRI